MTIQHELDLNYHRGETYFFSVKDYSDQVQQEAVESRPAFFQRGDIESWTVSSLESTVLNGMVLRGDTSDFNENSNSRPLNAEPTALNAEGR